MRSNKTYYVGATFALLVLAALLFGNINKSAANPDEYRASDPSVVGTYPTDGEVDVARNAVIEITFSESLDSAAINNTTFTLMRGSESIDGSLSFSGKDVTFTTQRSLEAETVYTAHVSINNSFPEQGIVDEDDGERTNGKEWRFTTGGNIETVEKVDIGSAANYVILAQSASQSDSASDITGEQGYDSKSNRSSANKTAYWVDNKDVEANRTEKRDTARTGAMRNESRTGAMRNESRTGAMRDTARSGATSQTDNLNRAQRDMMTAYANAEERSTVDFVDFKFQDANGVEASDWGTNRTLPGEVNSRNRVEMNNADSNNAYRSGIHNDGTAVAGTIELEPGIYMWNESVEISMNIVLTGGAQDVWIFQIPEGLTVNRNVSMSLQGGAVAEHVYWQVGGEVSIGESSHFEGIILSRDDITMKKGATLNGRMLTQSDITLDANTIAEPQFLTALPRD